jgi:hypothetical protein
MSEVENVSAMPPVYQNGISSSRSDEKLDAGAPPWLRPPPPERAGARLSIGPDEP